MTDEAGVNISQVYNLRPDVQYAITDSGLVFRNRKQVIVNEEGENVLHELHEVLNAFLHAPLSGVQDSVHAPQMEEEADRPEVDPMEELNTANPDDIAAFEPPKTGDRNREILQPVEVLGLTLTPRVIESSGRIVVDVSDGDVPSTYNEDTAATSTAAKSKLAHFWFLNIGSKFDLAQHRLDQERDNLESIEEAYVNGFKAGVSHGQYLEQSEF